MSERLIQNLQAALVAAGHEPDCPVVHGASVDCVPGGDCTDWQARAEQAEAEARKFRGALKITRSALNQIWEYAVPIEIRRIAGHALDQTRESRLDSNLAHIIRHRRNEIDDVAISGDLFRLERMSPDCWWLAVYRGLRETNFWLRWEEASRRIVATVRDDTIGCTNDTPEEG